MWILVYKVYWENVLSDALRKDTFDYLKEIFLARQSGRMKFNTPMWFVPCLFLVEMVYFFQKLKTLQFYV